MGFWIKHYITWNYRWRHCGRYLTSDWPQNDLSIGKSIWQLKKYILLFYSSTLIELNIHLVRINHVLWRHHDVIMTYLTVFGQIWPEWPFWSKMTKKNPEIKSWNTKIQQTAIIWQIFRWNSSFLVDFHAKNNQKWTQIFLSKMSFSLENLYFVAVKCYFWRLFEQFRVLKLSFSLENLVFEVSKSNFEVKISIFLFFDNSRNLPTPVLNRSINNHK